MAGKTDIDATYELWVYNYLVVRDEALGYSMPNEEEAADEWQESAREIVAGIDFARNHKSPTIATLTADNARLQSELAAMQADRDAAAEDERDRLYERASSYLNLGGHSKDGTIWWLEMLGAMLPADRAALRALAKEPTA